MTYAPSSEKVLRSNLRQSLGGLATRDRNAMTMTIWLTVNERTPIHREAIDSIGSAARKRILGYVCEGS